MSDKSTIEADYSDQVKDDDNVTVIICKSDVLRRLDKQCEHCHCLPHLSFLSAHILITPCTFNVSKTCLCALAVLYVFVRLCAMRVGMYLFSSLVFAQMV